MAAALSIFLLSGGVVPLGGQEPGGIDGLALLPENPRYFQYNGLPLVSFVYIAGPSVPTPVSTDDDRIEEVSRSGNHYYIAAHDAWVRATWETLYETLNDHQAWERLRRIARAALERDVLLSVILWSYKYEFAGEVGENWGGSNMIYPLGDPAWNEVVVDGRTKWDLWNLLNEKVVEATWEFPNVTYNMMWEYNVRWERDPEGTLHRHWASEIRRLGREVDPEVAHLISTEYGATHPETRGADFIVEEDKNAFWKWGATLERVRSYRVPLVFWSSNYWYALVNGVKFDSRFPVAPADYRSQLRAGFHPAESFGPPMPEALDYSLQARWYAENMRKWETPEEEPGTTKRSGTSDDMARAPEKLTPAELASLPEYVASTRPQLVNVEGYSRGIRPDADAFEFAAVYADPEGDPPAQAEVWVDRNGDGRFDPTPAGGERIAMKPAGDGSGNGVLYRAVEVSADLPEGEPLRYVFRFASAHWYPPLPGGLVPEVNAGISYRHWTYPFPARPRSVRR